jgi:NADPH-dependent curcumin reductase CurA
MMPPGDDLGSAHKPKLLKWADEGKIAWQQTVIDGLERVPDALNLYFTLGGALTGKLLVKAADV